jgi:hypothetical protein
MNQLDQIPFPFPGALEIRVRYALGKVYRLCNLGGDTALIGEALRDACDLAFRELEAIDADGPCPTLFADEPQLSDAWNRGAQRAARKRYTYERDNLPGAEALYELLTRGQSCEVNGHSLSPDEHGVWITNPYGADGLWQDVTIERVQKFLLDMAQDKEYGLVP